jgi:hypothetical protein
MFRPVQWQAENTFTGETRRQATDLARHTRVSAHAPTQ